MNKNPTNLEEAIEEIIELKNKLGKLQFILTEDQQPEIAKITKENKFLSSNMKELKGKISLIREELELGGVENTNSSSGRGSGGIDKKDFHKYLMDAFEGDPQFEELIISLAKNAISYNYKEPPKKKKSAKGVIFFILFLLFFVVTGGLIYKNEFMDVSKIVIENGDEIIGLDGETYLIDRRIKVEATERGDKYFFKYGKVEYYIIK